MSCSTPARDPRNAQTRGPSGKGDEGFWATAVDTGQGCSSQNRLSLHGESNLGPALEGFLGFDKPKTEGASSSGHILVTSQTKLRLILGLSAGAQNPQRPSLVADMRWPVKRHGSWWSEISVMARERAGKWRRRSTTLISADQNRTSWSGRSLPPTTRAHRRVHSYHEDLSGLVARPLSHLNRRSLGHHAPDETG